MWYKINMKNTEEIQKLLQELESLEEEWEDYSVKKYLTLDEIKFLIYMRKNKIDYDELMTKIKQQVSN